ncbi:multi antimicrobial extrusion protein MatE [Lihuaxuella thermophila]|nr:multi antimicrobial extrusion protein MatE [Lihuaxuella thermophila]
MLKQVLFSNYRSISFKELAFFFLPLGFSSLLVNLSHILINATLARSPYPEATIASYAVAMSLFGLFEKPVVLLRQTCSALVRDRISFAAMSKVTAYTLAAIFLLSLLIAYSPLSEWIFRYGFGAEEALVNQTTAIYQILMFVTIFSGLRCLFHGIIIYNRLTKWLTVGMVIRLIVMGMVALFFIATEHVHDGRVGAIIFLIGMFIECSVAVWEGFRLRKAMPEEIPDHPVHSVRPIFTFYRPLIFASIIAVLISPIIHAFLGWTDEAVSALASFAIASNVSNMVLSFFTYGHQTVLNFYKQHPRDVIRFTAMISLLPALLLAAVSFTPVGPWFLTTIMGLSGELHSQSLLILRIYILFALVFPWLDFCNGLLMLNGLTRIMAYSQLANFTVVLVSAFSLALWQPEWNGMIGALALSLGVLAEFAVDSIALNRKGNKFAGIKRSAHG